MDKKNFDKEFIIEEELKKLPAMPGVYLMHGDMDEVIEKQSQTIFSKINEKIRENSTDGRSNPTL